MTGSPVIFRPSLVARLAYTGFNFGFGNEVGIEQFIHIVRSCTNLSALHLGSYGEVTTAMLQGFFADGLPLRHLVPPGGSRFLFHVSQTSWQTCFGNLTHLELDNSRFDHPIALPDIPTLTHLLIESMMGDYSEMEMSHLTPHIELLPRSVRVFVLMLVSGRWNTTIPFVSSALAERIIRLNQPALVIGTSDRVVSIQSDYQHREHIILDFAN